MPDDISDSDLELNNVLEIDRLTSNFNTLMLELASNLSTFNQRIQELHDTFYIENVVSLLQLRKIKNSILKYATDHPELFNKTKTKTLNNVKFGFKNSRRRVNFEISEEEIIIQIKDFYPEIVNQVIGISEYVKKESIANVLPEKELESIGITVKQPQSQAYFQYVKNNFLEQLEKMLAQAENKGE